MLRLAADLAREVRRLIDERSRAPLHGEDVLSVLIRAQQAGWLSEEELVGEVSVLFLAAHETNSVALAWTLFLLSQHPRILCDLGDELHGELGGDAPRIDQFGRLPLLEGVIKESLRILPPVAWGTRAVDRPTQLGPFALPKGSRVLYSPYVTHILPEIYPYPRRFQPGRWTSFAPPPYAYIPFGGGPRLCIGYTMAMTFLRIALSVIVQRCALSLAPGARIDRSYQVTIAPKYGMPMVVQAKGTLSRPIRPRGTIHDMVALDD